MIITKLMTNTGEFDTNDSLENLTKQVAEVKESGGLLVLDRGSIDSLYRGEPCVDEQKVYLDLEVVEIHGYSTHQMTMKEQD